MKGAAAVASLPANEPILQVKDLRTYFFADEGVVRAVDGVTFEIGAGETLGIVGESGSGKTVSALSIMRLLEEPSRIVSGEVRFRGRNVVSMSEEELRVLRGEGMAMVFQDPMTSLNPVLRIARQLVEAMQVHRDTTDADGLERAVTLLGQMGIPTPQRVVHNFPHQLSGGMRQRVMLAMGFSNDPALLIADEPTTALDMTVQAQILELLRQLNTELGTAILLISHNLGVIASVCSRIVVMYAGEVVEEGATADLLSAPKHPYTWALLNAAPRLDQPTPQDRHLTTIEGTPPDPMDWPTGCRFLDRCPFKIDQCRMHPPLASVGARRTARCWVTQGGQALPSLSGPGPVAAAAPAPEAAATPAQERLLELRGLQKHFPVRGAGRGGKSGVVHALDGVDLDVYRGETVGLVGESGCGKSTLARLVLRLQRPTAGVIRFEGQDISQASDAEMRPFRRRMQMVFQDPYASLNPRMRVGDTLAEPIRFHRLASGDRMIAARVDELLSLVGLPLQAAAKFPHEFSGGQRQRVAIARALAVQPDFIVADEPISSLDVNIQAQIINLLVDLQSRLGLTYLFIAHDLAVVRHISDRIVVLYLGKVAEIASSADLFDRPLHPYTRSLIASVPTLNSAAGRTPFGLRGEAPSVTDPPSGCRFRTRCPIAQPICAAEVPLLQEHAPGQWASCHFPGKV